MLTPDIRTLSPLKLVGNQLSLSFANYDVTPLWRSFMPRLKEIEGRASSDLFSLSIYPPNFFETFDPQKLFVKWAAVAVGSFDQLPEGMESLVLEGGTYAVFHHRGDAQAFYQLHQYVYSEWIPSSGYELADEPHFELLGAMYKNNAPDSEEELWVPVKKVG